MAGTRDGLKFQAVRSQDCGTSRSRMAAVLVPDFEVPDSADTG
jgi:hypothetical protein